MSPRPKKLRNCQSNFCRRAFKPTGISMGEIDKVEIYHDELEVLNLCDGKGYTQEQAGKEMGVSRGTVQRILSGARKKVALALNNGQALIFVESCD
ncbi:MAG: DUF134 domain-containing protein [Desulfotalea sp.]